MPVVAPTVDSPSIAFIGQRGPGGLFFIFASTASFPPPSLVELQLTPQASAVPPFQPQYQMTAKQRSAATQFS